VSERSRGRGESCWGWLLCVSCSVCLGSVCRWGCGSSFGESGGKFKSEEEIEDKVKEDEVELQVGDEA
jgi:hypothetical protein